MCALRNMSAGLVDIFKGRVWRTLKVGVGTDHMYGGFTPSPSGGGGVEAVGGVARLQF